ncbi:transposase [Viridibacterium curvum]|uniref:Transposase n=1 Tax=Viridibacterium curvum TaxID=1101404 RepID=A0ABP9QM31_9RHOO
MSRLPRLHIPGLPQLILQRGNNRSTIFVDEADFRAFRDMLRESARESAVPIHAYVLMPDHLHILTTPPEAGAVGAMMQRLGRRYVRYFNNRHARSGTLWDGRYRSTVIEPVAWLLPAYRYIEQNPVRAGIVGEAAHYPWSSCRHHLGLATDPLVTDHAGYWALGNTPFDRQAAYRALVEATPGSDELADLRHAAHRSWMLGEADLASEAGANRRIAPLPKGRPRKQPPD